MQRGARRIVRQRQREVARRDHRVDQVADHVVQLPEGGARIVVLVRRQVGQRVLRRERHQAAGQRHQLVEHVLGMVLAIARAMRERRRRRADHVEHPERRRVARMDLERLAAVLAMALVQRRDLGIELGEQGIEHAGQAGGRGQRDGGRDEGGIEFEAAGGGALDADDGEGEVARAGRSIRKQAYLLLQIRNIERQRLREQVCRCRVLARIACFTGHIASMQIQRRQRRVVREGRSFGRQAGQIHRQRRRVGYGRIVDLAIGEQQRQGFRLQHVVGQFVGFPYHPTHAPQAGIDRHGRLLQAYFVIAIRLAGARCTQPLFVR